MSAQAHERVLIVDFGSQVTQLIARRLRESGVYCEIHPFTISEDRVRDFAPRAIILSGGPASLTEAASPRAPDIAFRLGVPVLGDVVDERPEAGDESVDRLGVHGHGIPASPSRSVGIVMGRRSAR